MADTPTYRLVAETLHLQNGSIHSLLAMPGFDLEQCRRDDCVTTFLLEACRHADVKVVKWLVVCGADLLGRGPHNWNVLHMACWKTQVGVSKHPAIHFSTAYSGSRLQQRSINRLPSRARSRQEVSQHRRRHGLHTYEGYFAHR